MFIVFFLCGFGLVGSQSNITYTRDNRPPGARDLIPKLLDGYVNTAIPKFNASETMNVSVSFTLIKLIDLTDREQVMNVIGFLGMSWKDDFLTWNPAEYGGLAKIVLPRLDIWSPDIVVRDTKSAPYDVTKAEFDYVEVRSDGSCAFYPVGTLELLCPLNIQHFPFDQHICAISLGNWILTSDLQVMWPAGVSMRSIASHIQWRVLGATSQRYCYSYGKDVYDMIRVYFKLERKSKYYVINFIFPIIILTVLSCTNFIVPLDHDQRVNISMVILLSYVVFQLALFEIMPRTSDKFPYIATLIFVEMGFLCGSIIMDSTLQWLAALDPIDGLPNPLPGGQYKTTTCRAFCSFCFLKNYAHTEQEDQTCFSCSKTEPEEYNTENWKEENSRPSTATNIRQKSQVIEVSSNVPPAVQRRESDFSNGRKPKTWRDLALRVDKYFFLLYVFLLAAINLLFFAMTLVVPNVPLPTRGKCPGYTWTHVDVLDESELLQETYMRYEDDPPDPPVYPLP